MDITLVARGLQEVGVGSAGCGPLGPGRSLGDPSPSGNWGQGASMASSVGGPHIHQPRPAQHLGRGRSSEAQREDSAGSPGSGSFPARKPFSTRFTPSSSEPGRAPHPLHKRTPG